MYLVQDKKKTALNIKTPPEIMDNVNRFVFTHVFIQQFVFSSILVSNQSGSPGARNIYKVSPCVSNKKNCYPYQWQSNINVEVDRNHHSLLVRFSHAEQVTNFVNYTVVLQRDNYNTTETTNETEVVFNDICNGNYVIYVKPLDPYPSVKNKCQCYKSYGRCIVCRTTVRKMIITGLNDSKCNDSANLEPETLKPVKTVPVKSVPVRNSPVTFPSGKDLSTIKNQAPEKSSTTTARITKNIVPQTRSNRTEITKPLSHSSSLQHSSTTSNTNEIKDKNKTVLWAVVGSSVAILLAISFICFMCSTTRESLTDKKILFLYSHDHQHHLDVGKAMATYLQHFKCHVLYPPLFAEEEIKQWLHKTVADCDFVLLLHSECIKRQSEPWASGLEYPQLRDNRNENVLMSILTMIRECPLLQLYHSKYISCRLEHLSEGYVLTEFPSVQNFVLTRDLKKLVYYIHRIPPNSVLKTLTLRSSDSSTSSMALQQAAQKAAEFEKNKMWFTQKYSYLVPRCGVLNDKCDCRSALNEEFDGTVDIPKLPLNSFHDVNFDDSMSKRCYYFNDIHSFSEMSQVSSELAMLNERNDQRYKNRYSLLPSLSEGVTDCVSNWTDVTYASSRGSNPVCV
ncbi:uncharacterized protein LOC115217418 isoform X2 [Octopus sinensis]|uniref:Uncharacterized protein LOC115217418 isoform X2 n=1 Tax=Octopus sinensis TaxID=2607531 RepID=A0A7E6F5F8_9MOLL|nr:uncharacterized protein LOC115217418 isoform X2 [Octopus sinensis]